METRLRRGRPVAATDTERRDLQALERVLYVEDGCGPTVIAPDGGSVPMPHTLTQLLHDITEVLAAGDAVDVVAVPRELTVGQAAAFLDESEEDVQALIGEGRLATTGDADPVRIRLADLVAFADQEDAERRDALEELVRLNQELGLYSKR
jgi:hypothetical protein